MRAAVVGGGAYMAGKHKARRQEDPAQQEADQDARISELEQQQAQASSYQQASPQQAPPPASAPAPSSMTDQLNQLAALHQQGVLTDDEFTAAKAKLFGT